MPQVQGSGANYIGAFPVYKTDSNVALFGQILAKKQAADQAEQKALADKLANINTNGLREQDKDAYYKLYNDWRTETQKGYGLKGQEKFNAQANSDKIYSQLNQFVSASKAKTLRDASNMQMQVKTPFAFSPEGKVMLQKSYDAVTGSPDDIVDITQVPVGHDYSKIPVLIESLKKPVLDAAQEQSPVYGTPYKVGNKTLTPVTNEYKVDPDKWNQSVKIGVLASDPLKSYIHELYPDPNLTEDQRISMFAADTMPSKPAKIGTPVENFKDAAPDNYYAHLAARMAAQGANDLASEDFSVTPKQFTTTEGAVADAYGKQIPAHIVDKPMPSAAFTHYTTVNPVTFDAPQQKHVYDIAGRKNIPMKAGKFNITGIGVTDIMGKPDLTVTVSDPDHHAKEYVMPLNAVPANIQATKPFKAALSAIEKSMGGQSQAPTIPTVKVSQQDNDALNWLKANPNAPQAKAIRASLKAKGLIK